MRTWKEDFYLVLEVRLTDFPSNLSPSRSIFDQHISHPSLARFISSFSTPSQHVLVIERIEGGELFDLLDKNQIEVSKREWLVRRLYAEMANAVGWMHSVNLVHRDLKLESE